MCDWLGWTEHKIAPTFISFDDLVPSRYALSYIEQSNPNAYNVNVAFIALDAENLGELVNHSYHTDFGDNILPYYKSNTNRRIDNYSETSDSSEEEDNEDEDNEDGIKGRLNVQDLARIHTFMSPSILSYLDCNNA
jgi:hypothetical protein